MGPHPDASRRASHGRPGRAVTGVRTRKASSSWPLVLLLAPTPRAAALCAHGRWAIRTRGFHVGEAAVGVARAPLAAVVCRPACARVRVRPGSSVESPNELRCAPARSPPHTSALSCLSGFFVYDLEFGPVGSLPPFRGPPGLTPQPLVDTARSTIVHTMYISSENNQPTRSVNGLENSFSFCLYCCTPSCSSSLFSRRPRTPPLAPVRGAGGHSSTRATAPTSASSSRPTRRGRREEGGEINK